MRVVQQLIGLHKNKEKLHHHHQGNGLYEFNDCIPWTPGGNISDDVYVESKWNSQPTMTSGECTCNN